LLFFLLNVFRDVGNMDVMEHVDQFLSDRVC